MKANSSTSVVAPTSKTDYPAVTEVLPLPDLRIGFVSDRSVCNDNGKLWVDAGVGRVLQALGPACRQLTVAMALSPRRHAFHDTPLEIPLDQYLPLPWLPSIARGFHKVAGCRRAIREVEGRSDVVIVQLPFAAPLALLRGQRPRLYHICSNLDEMARSSNVYCGWRRWPTVLIGNAIDSIQSHLVHGRHARVIANGRELLAHFNDPPGRAVVSTTILNSEILSVPRRRPADAPFRVLFVGFLRPSKGIDTLIEAFDQVLDRIPGAELMIAGPKDPADHGMVQYLDKRLAALSQRATVHRLGHLTFGPELFQCYADADVLALPSRSEGTPRVLVEARAFGCPVIGSAVGGTPSSITHEADGLLIPPDDIPALASAILRIATDRPLRDRLVAGGIQRARASTVESFVGAMTLELQELVTDAAQPNTVK